jgi:hypothetical protein
LNGAIEVDEEEGFVTTVVEMRDADWAAEGSTCLKETVSAAWGDGAGRSVDGFLVKVGVGVKGFVFQKEV